MDKLNITGDIYLSVSKYRGKKYVSLRRWYEKDGELAPSTNGLNVEPDVWADILAKMDEIKAFVAKELK